MGCLHDGHLHLCKVAKGNSDCVIASIFVNPAQFAPNEDFDRYPRQLESDIEMLKNVGVKAVFAPTVPEMYPTGITMNVKEQIGTFVEVLGISHQLEGSFRPHFFRGVATVVTKLFNAVQPDIAVFGQKDVQQCVVLRRMTRDLLMPIDIIVSPTMRDSDGLAMSSRNRYLTPEDRQRAPILYRALKEAEGAYNLGERSRQKMIKMIKDVLGDTQIDYISIADPQSLQEVETIGKEGAILSATIRIGKTRLLDNILLGYDFHE